MSNIIAIDGFDIGPSNIYAYLPDTTGSPTTSGGRYSGRCLDLSNNASCTKTLNTDYSTLITGFAFKITTLPSAEKSIIRFRYGVYDQTVLRLRTNGILKVTRDNGGYTLGESILSLSVGTWYYVEFKTVFSSSPTGSVVVRVDGSDWLNVTNVITVGGSGNVTANKIRIGDSNTSPWQICVDDMYIDSTTFNGPYVRICTQRPIADGTENDWSSTRYNKTEAVNEENIDIDTNYISSSVSLNQQNFKISPSPDNLTWMSGEAIQAVQVTGIIRKESGDPSINAFVGVKPPLASDYMSSAVALTTTYAKVSGLWTLNPDTSLEWNITDIEDGEFFVLRN
jgi:hypothetical protein